LSLKSAEK